MSTQPEYRLLSQLQRDAGFDGVEVSVEITYADGYREVLVMPAIDAVGLTTSPDRGRLFTRLKIDWGGAWDHYFMSHVPVGLDFRMEFNTRHGL